MTDLTPLLNRTFQPGLVAGFDSNATSIMVDGTGALYDRRANLSWPALTIIDGLPNHPIATNASSEYLRFFSNGGFYGTAWNGTSWLLPGTVKVGPRYVPFLLALRNGEWTNLTPQIEPFFSSRGPLHQYGIWALGWNGSSWLIGGNDSQGAVLLALDGNSVRNLTGQLPPSSRGIAWVQYIAWNGTGWLVGGFNVLGLWSQGSYRSLLEGSPFAGAGVFAAGWDRKEWLVGGGQPAAIAWIRGHALAPGPALPAGFDRWVNFIAPVGPEAWMVGGNGTAAGQTGVPSLYLLCSSHFYNETGLVPSSFNGGQIQYGACVPVLHGLLIAGSGARNGAYNYDQSYAQGAMALVQFPNGCAS